MLKPSPRLIPQEKIGPYSYDEYQNCVISFHDFASPVVILGGFMVNLGAHYKGASPNSGVSPS